MNRQRILPHLLLVLLVALAAAHAAVAQSAPPLAQQVEVRRTDYGVPHIQARNLTAAAYALAWVQLEDHGARVVLGLVRARGELARWFGRDSIERDFVGRPAHARAVALYASLEQATRDVYEGFAAGVNRWVELHPDEMPPGFSTRFTGADVLAQEMGAGGSAAVNRFLARIDSGRGRRARQADDPSDEAGTPASGEDPPDEGSNAWAFAPGRTKSRRAILLRNPHLSWSAGYYEAHVTVPGVLDFYGDFRVGGPFGVIGGFNRDLGWSTTNNEALLEQIYALDVDSTRVDHYLLDGGSHPLERTLVTVEFRNGPGLSSETREVWRTSLGPVIHRGNGKVYVLRAAGVDDPRGGEQFLRMMRARSLTEWKDAMRMRARRTSSFTYADRAGNIFYLWNATVPSLPHPSGGDTTAIPVRSTTDVWVRYVPFDSLPQLLNPKGGYIHNENDPPWYTNMRQRLDPSRYPPYFPEPRLRLRSQLAIALIDNDRKLSVADVIALKHSYRMLLADRVRADLVAAVRASAPAAEVAAAADLVAGWDGTTAPDSRGGVLFERWWRRYTAGADADTMFASPWTPSAPLATPRGLRFSERAATAFAQAVDETRQRYGGWNVSWGEVHRVRLGRVDVPVGGCNGDLGCFRVLQFRDTPDGKREAVGGDGWILVVEFGDRPRAWSVLAYGESARPDSPHHDDQAGMFARGELKPVAWTPAEIEARTIRRYHPGELP
ncbi:MAG TPA: penicillin acylase family protein [Gemmatimonadaceae bacterium]|nr:penicillin acylase family protein [Gemmatimonadaceae bacterium]